MTADIAASIVLERILLLLHMEILTVVARSRLAVLATTTHLPTPTTLLRLATVSVVDVLVARAPLRGTATALEAKAAQAAERKGSEPDQRAHDDGANDTSHGGLHARVAAAVLALLAVVVAARGHVLAPDGRGARLAHLAPLRRRPANRRHLFEKRLVRDGAAVKARPEEGKDLKRRVFVGGRAVHEPHAEVLGLGKLARVVGVLADQLKHDGGAGGRDVAQWRGEHVVAGEQAGDGEEGHERLEGAKHERHLARVLFRAVGVEVHLLGDGPGQRAASNGERDAVGVVGGAGAGVRHGALHGVGILGEPGQCSV